MLVTKRGRYIMADAWTLYAGAIEMLDQGRIRNAADKAWGATKRATDALIPERTGEEPERTTLTSSGIRALGRQNEELRSLHMRHVERVPQLPGDCFYDGHCAPEDYFEELILDAADHISDAEAIAAQGD